MSWIYHWSTIHSEVKNKNKMKKIKEYLSTLYTHMSRYSNRLSIGNIFGVAQINRITPTIRHIHTSKYSELPSHRAH